MALAGGLSGADHDVIALLVPGQELAQLADGGGLVHIGKEDAFAPGLPDAGPDGGWLAPVGDIEEAEAILVLDKALDQGLALIRGFVIDNDHFPGKILLQEVLVDFVQYPSLQVLFLIVAGDDYGNVRTLVCSQHSEAMIHRVTYFVNRIPAHHQTYRAKARPAGGSAPILDFPIPLVCYFPIAF